METRIFIYWLQMPCSVVLIETCKNSNFLFFFEMKLVTSWHWTVSGLDWPFDRILPLHRPFFVHWSTVWCLVGCFSSRHTIVGLRGHVCDRESTRVWRSCPKAVWNESGVWVLVNEVYLLICITHGKLKPVVFFKRWIVTTFPRERFVRIEKSEVTENCETNTWLKEP